jgi:hypothetical protein
METSFNFFMLFISWNTTSKKVKSFLERSSAQSVCDLYFTSAFGFLLHSKIKRALIYFISGVAWISFGLSFCSFSLLGKKPGSWSKKLIGCLI